MGNIYRICCSVSSFLFIVMGSLLLFGRNTWLDRILRLGLSLSPDSPSFDQWKTLPVPLKMSVYVFDVANAKEVEAGEPGHLRQVGPFVFSEMHNKTKVHWNPENGTVTYQQIRTWKFLENESLDLDQVVTILNPPAVTVGSLVQNLSLIAQEGVSIALLVLKEQLFVRKSVRDILFDGYSDPLLNAASILSPYIPGFVDRFGFFYGRNGSDWTDGVFNIHTGVENMEHFGQVAQWNYTKHTTFFPDQCGEVRGSAELFPPRLYYREYVELYSNDLCRPLRANLREKDAKDFGIVGNKYVVDKSFFANSTENKDNWCYENGHPRPSGVFDSSTCRFKSPVFISNPHFLDADPSYIRQFTPESLHPNRSEHESYLILEPFSGLPVKVDIKMQINMLVPQIKHILLFKNIRPTFFPIIWVSTTMEPDKTMAEEILLLSWLVNIFSTVGLVIIVSGLALLIFMGIRIFSQRNATNTEETFLITKEDDEEGKEETAPNTGVESP